MPCLQKDKLGEIVTSKDLNEQKITHWQYLRISI